MQAQRLYFLIGMMGAGKTTLGKSIAQKLNYDFIDTDAVIENYCGITISEIFILFGEIGFRTIERALLRQILFSNFAQPTIIACGGGLPIFYNNFDWLKQKGKIIYLKTDLRILTQRLKNQVQNRPLLAGKIEALPQILQAREKIYQKSDFIFENNQSFVVPALEDRALLPLLNFIHNTV